MFQRIIGIMCLCFSVWYMCQDGAMWERTMIGIVGMCGIYFILGKEII